MMMMMGVVLCFSRNFLHTTKQLLCTFHEISLFIKDMDITRTKARKRAINLPSKALESTCKDTL